jgi:hypothetical protein
MLSQTVARASRRGLRRLHTATKVAPGRAGIAVGAATTFALGATAYAFVAPAANVYSDAEPPKMTIDATKAIEPTKVTQVDDDGVLRTLGWGTNRCVVLAGAAVSSIRGALISRCRSNVLSPDKAEKADMSTPTQLPFLDGVALRDLALHGHHGACVDAHGDVYQWGLGFFGKVSSDDLRPTRTLQGKVGCVPVIRHYLLSHVQNITKLQVTDSRVFALSSTGQVYVLSTKMGQGSSASKSGWLWGSGENSTFVELESAQKLGWGEK